MSQMSKVSDPLTEHHRNNKVDLVLKINDKIQNLSNEGVLSVLDHMKNHKLLGNGEMSTLLAKLLILGADNFNVQDLLAVQDCVDNEVKSVGIDRNPTSCAVSSLNADCMRYISLFLNRSDIVLLACVCRDTHLLIHCPKYPKYRYLNCSRTEEETRLVVRDRQQNVWQESKNWCPTIVQLYRWVPPKKETLMCQNWFRHCLKLEVESPTLLKYIPLGVLFDVGHHARSLQLSIGCSLSLHRKINRIILQNELDAWADSLVKYRENNEKTMRKVANLKWDSDFVLDGGALLKALKNKLESLELSSPITLWKRSQFLKCGVKKLKLHRSSRIDPVSHKFFKTKSKQDQEESGIEILEVDVLRESAWFIRNYGVSKVHTLVIRDIGVVAEFGIINKYFTGLLCLSFVSHFESQFMMIKLLQRIDSLKRDFKEGLILKIDLERIEFVFDESEFESTLRSLGFVNDTRLLKRMYKLCVKFGEKPSGSRRIEFELRMGKFVTG